MVFLVSICNYFLVCINGIDGASGKKKNPFANAGDVRGAGLTPRSGRSPGGGYGNPLQYSCLENSMDRGAWGGGGLMAHGATKSRTQLKHLVGHNLAHTHTFLYVHLPMKEEEKVELMLLYISSITAFITRFQLLIEQLIHYHIRHMKGGVMSSCPFSVAEHFGSAQWLFREWRVTCYSLKQSLSSWNGIWFYSLSYPSAREWQKKTQPATLTSTWGLWSQWTREWTHPVGCQLSTHHRMLDNLWREITAQLDGSWFKTFNILSGWSVVRTVREMCLPGASPCLVRSLEKLKTMTTAPGLFTMYGSLLMTWHQASEPSCLVDDSSLPPRHGSQQTEEYGGKRSGNQTVFCSTGKRWSSDSGRKSVFLPSCSHRLGMWSLAKPESS